jgi:hypothetical protein
MRLIRTSIIAVLALFALATVGAAVAVGEEDKNSPSILLLEKGVSSLEVIAKGGEVTTETLSGKTVLSATTEAKVKNCEAIAGSEEKDVKSCKDVTLTLTGVKKETIACRSENAKGEKDPIETVLALVDLTLGTELTATKVLQPLGIGKVLGVGLEVELTVVCGLVKIKMKGTLGCGVPLGLKNIPTTEELEVTCKMKNGDQEIGTCVSECESLKTDPFLMNLGNGFEDSAKLFTMRGKANKDLFIDD